MESKRDSKGYKEKGLRKPIVLGVLLYNCETWTLKVAAKRKLKVFEMSCLRRIERVTIRDRIRNAHIREEMSVRVDVVKRIQGR